MRLGNLIFKFIKIKENDLKFFILEVRQYDLLKVGWKSSDKIKTRHLLRG